MDFKDLLTDDDAVSPVIGVILMVAITVILAAVIAAFVLGLGDTNDVAPNPTFDSDYNGTTSGPFSQSLQIDMTGGDTFTASQVSVAGDSNQAGSTWAEVTQNDPVTTISDVSADDEITAGNQIVIEVDDSSFEIELVWNAEDGGTSSTLFSRSGPDS